PTLRPRHPSTTPFPYTTLFRSEYARCKEHQQQVGREVEHCFEGIDVLMAPATTGPAPLAATTGDPLFNSPWSYTGLPSLSLPAGDRKSTRLNSSHVAISYAVFC